MSASEDRYQKVRISQILLSHNRAGLELWYFSIGNEELKLYLVKWTSVGYCRLGVTAKSCTRTSIPLSVVGKMGDSCLILGRDLLFYYVFCFSVSLIFI